MDTTLRVRPAEGDLVGNIQRAMLDFFSVLCSMPHINPGALRIPPPEGWQNVGDTELRARGKTEDAINFIRHLPCLVHETGDEPPWLTPQIQSLYFCQGKTTSITERDAVETPKHVVWIGDARNRDGSFLLLDTINGTFTEVAILGYTMRLTYEEYEALPAESRWMAHETLPAIQWLARERMRLQHLLYMPVLPRQGGGDVQFYYRCSNARVEPSFIVTDIELTSAGPEDDEEFEGSETDDVNDDAASHDSEDYEDTISSEELRELENEAQSPLPQASEPNGATPGASYLTWLLFETQADTNPKNQEIYEIYRRNGWGSASFDRDSCARELTAWSEDRHAESVAKAQAEAPQREKEKQDKFAEYRRRRELMEQERREEAEATAKAAADTEAE